MVWSYEKNRWQYVCNMKPSRETTELVWVNLVLAISSPQWPCLYLWPPYLACDITFTRNDVFVWCKWHFDGFNFNLAERSHSNSNRSLVRWSSTECLKTTILFRYTKHNLKLIPCTARSVTFFRRCIIQRGQGFEMSFSWSKKLV